MLREITETHQTKANFDTGRFAASHSLPVCVPHPRSNIFDQSSAVCSQLRIVLAMTGNRYG